jgi:DNA-binding protein HU-beta
MTKADIVNEIVNTTGIDKVVVLGVVESYMDTIKKSMIGGENIYFRGFGSFVLKKRAAKLGRNITKNTAVKIPAHMIPSIKFCSEFVEEVGTKVKVK